MSDIDTEAIPPANALAPQDLVDRVRAISAEAKALVVDSEDAKSRATVMLATIAGTTKALESKRVAAVSPLNEQVKAINAAFKSVTVPLAEADSSLRENVLAYNREQSRRAAEAAAEAERKRLESEALQRKAEEEERKKSAQAAQADKQRSAAIADALLEKAIEAETQATVAQAAAVLPQRTVRTDAGTSSVRKVWTFKLVDIGRVPVAYLTLNEVAVRKAIGQGVREINGVDIFQEDTLSVRR